MVDIVGKKSFFYKLDQGVQSTFKYSGKIISNTEHLDKVLKFVTSIFKTLDYLDLSPIFKPLKGIIKALSTTSETIAATKVVSTVRDVANRKIFKRDEKTKTGTLKLASKMLFGFASVFTTTKWVLDIAGLAKIAGHFIAKNAFRFIPGIGFFVDIPVMIGSLFNVIANSITLKKFDDKESVAKLPVKNDDGSSKFVKGRTSEHLKKWEARKSLFKEMTSEDKNAETIARLKKEYLKNAALTNPDNTNSPEDKWNSFSSLDTNSVEFEAKATKAEEKVKLYSLKLKTVTNERVKNILSIVGDIAKVILVSMSITASVLAIVAITIPFPLTPFFIGFGLIAATMGLTKMIIEYKGCSDKEKYRHALAASR